MPVTLDGDVLTKGATNVSVLLNRATSTRGLTQVQATEGSIRYGKNRPGLGGFGKYEFSPWVRTWQGERGQFLPHSTDKGPPLVLSQWPV